MESVEARAARYERSHPATDLPTAQLAERQERLDVKSRDYGSRTRFFLMPELPWHKEAANAED